MNQHEDLTAHVSYFSNLITIYEFFERTGNPAPGHIKDLIASAQSHMEDLTKEPSADETRQRINHDDKPQARTDLQGRGPLRSG